MNTRITALLFSSLLFSTAVFGQTIIGSWAMGDDDAGAANGNAVNATLTASVGTDLSLAGSGLTYTTNVSPQSSGSLAVNFTGSGSYTVANNLGMSTNFAMETWVNFSSVATTQWVMLIGNGAFSGTGLLFDSGTGKLGLAKSGDNIYFRTPVLSTSTWYHFALVVDENSDASLYFNGNLIAGTVTLSSFAAQFSLGDAQDGHAYFNGILDDARVFTFATGTFNTSMLNYTAVPEPSTWASWAGLAALVVACIRRRGAAAK